MGAMPKKGGSSSVLNVDIDENSDKSVQQQLKEALIANSVRVIDLFREWDDDGSGNITKKEWRRAMNELGLRVDLEEIDLLFDGFDPDDSGQISLEELNSLLKRNAKVLDLSSLTRGPAPPASGITALRRQLDAKKAQCAQLEAARAEHDAADRACETLEREMSELRKQLERINSKISLEEKRKAELDEKVHANADPLHSMDVAALQRSVEMLRKRNAALRKTHSKCSDPAATLREEEALAKRLKDVEALEKERQTHDLELRQLKRQVEAATNKAEKGRGGGSSRADAAKQQEAYVKRLQEMAARGRETNEQRSAAAASLDDEWRRWVHMLAQCAEVLTARAEAGEEGASIARSPTPPVLPVRKQKVPVAPSAEAGEVTYEEIEATRKRNDELLASLDVIEAVRKGEAKRSSLKTRIAESEAKEKALSKKLANLQAKVDQQREMVKKGLDKGPAASAKAPPNSEPLLPAISAAPSAVSQ